MSADTSAYPVLKDRLVLACLGVSLAGGLGFLAWAGLVKLDEGVSAPGAVVVENDRQVVQHLEGGIIAELLVREGERVEAGEPVIVLQDTASQAGRDQILQEIAALQGSEQRLLALQAGEEPDFSGLELLDLDEDDRQDIVARQQRLFDEQNQALDADLAVLTARRDGAEQTAELKREQIASSARALAATQAQLASARAMLAQQMARQDEVNALERDVASLEGDAARLEAERVQALTEAADMERQISQTRARHTREIAEELVDVRARLLSASEELLGAQDVLDRSVIPAPQSGVVLNLQFATQGGVVRPGEPIMEIVPEEAGVVASVRIMPTDRARVFEGQRVRTQIQAYKGWDAPPMNGEVISVSADVKSDGDQTPQYYEVRVRIPQEELDRAPELQLIPGMPVTAFIFSGARRTTLEYLFEPITESLFRGLRTS